MNNREVWKTFAGQILDNGAGNAVVVDSKGLFDYMKVSIDKDGATGTSIGITTRMPGSAEYKTPRDSAGNVGAIDLSTENEFETPTNATRYVRLEATGISGPMTYRVACRMVKS